MSGYVFMAQLRDWVPHEIVDYLMFQYLPGDTDVAPPSLPVVAAPTIPDKPVPASQ